MKLAGSDSDQVRINWVANALKSILKGARILDAGAGELRLKPYCAHLDSERTRGSRLAHPLLTNKR